MYYKILCFTLFLFGLCRPATVLLGQTDQEAHFQAGLALYQRSEIVAAAGDWDSLILYAQQAKPHFEKAENWEYYINSINGQLVAYYYKADYESCNKYLEEALPIASARLQPADEAYGFLLNMQGLIEHENGNYLKEIEAYKASLVSAEALGDTMGIANTYLNIGDAYKVQGDENTALDYFSESIRLREQQGDAEQAPWIARLYMDIGDCHLALGAHAEAEAAYRETLDFMDRFPEAEDPFWKQIVVQSQRGLAEVYLKQHQLAQAEAIAQLAIETQADYPFFARYSPFEILGRVYLERKESGAAIAVLKRAVEEAEAEYANYQKHEEVAGCYLLLADAHLQAGDGSTALRNYQEALVKGSFDFESTDYRQNPVSGQFINKLEGMTILQGKVHCLKTLAEKDQDYWPVAHETALLGNQLIAELRESLLSEQSKIALSNRARPFLEQALSVAYTYYLMQGEPSVLNDAFRYIGAHKALALMEARQERQARHLQDLPAAEAKRWIDFQNKLHYFDQRISRERQKGTAADLNLIRKWEQSAFDLQRDFEDFQADLNRQFPDYAASRDQIPVARLNAVAAFAAQEKALILEYFVGAEESFVFSVQGGGVQFRKLAPTNSWKPDLTAFLEELRQAPASDTYLEAMRRFQERSTHLFALLLEPELSRAVDVQRLVIIQEDILGYLPFEVLLQGPVDPALPVSKWPFLLFDYSVQYHFSSALLLEEQQGRTFAESFLGVAPTFEARRGQSPLSETKEASGDRSMTCADQALYDLVCNQDEVARIQAIVGGRSLQAEAADAAGFLRLKDQYRILHLATHACVDPAAPNLSRIRFASGELANYDLLGLRLQNELVVLSACNTGNGALYPGEGILSLGRGFYQAGCPSLLSSLWAVDDCATADLMVLFYEGLEAGLSKDAALAAAKRRYLERAPKVQQHPYYWAGFVLIGEAAPLELARAQWWWLIGLGAAFGLFIGIRYFLRRKPPRS